MSTNVDSSVSGYSTSKNISKQRVDLFDTNDIMMVMSQLAPMDQWIPDASKNARTFANNTFTFTMVDASPMLKDDLDDYKLIYYDFYVQGWLGFATAEDVKNSRITWDQKGSSVKF